MYKTAIIYCSLHHKNTEKLVKAIKSKYNITLIDASVHNSADLSVYELIGFASGIAFGKFYSPVEKFLSENLPENKKINAAGKFRRPLLLWNVPSCILISL